MYSLLSTVFLLSTPIHAAINARVWTHFYPNCPGDPFSNLDTYENYEESAPSQVITTGQCANIGVPSYEHNLVSAISVDAEILSNRPGHPFQMGSGSKCNISVHEVPECIDPPLITQELHNGVAVSPCEARRFAAYSEVWLQLVCDNDNEESLAEQAEDIPRLEDTTSVDQADNIQTPGSNSFSWSKAQTEHSEREPDQEDRVNNAGHAESEQLVHKIMEMIKTKHATLVSGKHPNSTHKHHFNITGQVNGTAIANGTAPVNRTVISRRKLSVLRNRRARLY
ncbi:hypothetical protein N7462_005718 [Penicillium macrosclerotiorum]|uniref:uncharacterized protein n=1 Tax=Penicillium macrosclerotiorum TaxID=303699 RepID=UPI00254852BC|nr:uncharacterized protein N7462_005718 [Penicillium macrosclerotiorum]KAJ5682553.1 hypothetical protein N7462_005718 [Penicillium macrosclerotiorum]